MTGTAHISDCGLYRYRLTRALQPKLDRSYRYGTCTFVMLNPSTADAEQDDPTIRRCIAYATRWGFSHLAVVNLYALRATNPRDLWTADDPIGPLNDHSLALAFGYSDRLVAAWGAHAPRSRVDQILAIPHHPHRCLGKTKAGAPRHPLYLRADAELQPWP